MKRTISLLLALMMLLSLTACGEDGLSFKPGGDTSKDELIYPNDDGYALGYVGDTLRTSFFDMTVKDPYTCAEYDGLTPDEGYKFLVADITIYNHTNSTQPMYDTDFEVMWEQDDDDAWAWPECDETQGADGETLYSTRSDKQIPVEFDLGIHKTEEGVLLYQVPEDSKDYFIAYYEVFEASQEGGDPEYGDSFYVRFSA